MSKAKGWELLMVMILGLTGGIATGKSTVVKFFQEYQFPVVDADIIAREVVAIGSPGLKVITEEFGTDILQKNGSLDRKSLGKIIFSNPQRRVRLNQLLAPFLRTEIKKQIQDKQTESDLVIVDIPLLYEEDYEREVDQVAVVYLPEKLQIERLMDRNLLSKEEAMRRVNSQWSIEYKKEKAAIVFDNQNTIEDTKKQVTHWLKKNQFI